MAEEEKHEEHKEHKKKLPFNLKISRVDIISIIVLIIFITLISLPTYLPKDKCEVSRPAFKCTTFKDVLIENCAYWGKYNCDTTADESLPQIEWYIGNLCDLQNQYHNSDLDCSSLKKACNQITEKQTCSSV